MWILFFVIVNGPMATAEFVSKSDCLAAAKQVQKDLKLPNFVDVRTSCVYSGE